MKRLRGSLVAKIIALVLLMVSATIGAVGIAGTAYLYQQGVYERADGTLKNLFFEQLIFQDVYRVFEEYFMLEKYYAEEDAQPDYYTESMLEVYKENFSEQSTNYYCIIRDSNGNIVFESQTPGAYIYKEIRKMWDYGDDSQYIAESYVRAGLPVNDEYRTAERIADSLENGRYTLIVITAVCVVLSVILFIFLMCGAGHRDGTDEIYENFADKIPFDLLTACMLCGIAAIRAVYSEVSSSIQIVNVVIIVAAGAAVFLILLMFCMTFATRCKSGRLFTNTVIFWAVSIVIRLVKRCADIIIYIMRSIDAVWKTAIGYLAISTVELVYVSDSSIFRAAWPLWVIIKLAAGTALLIAAVNFKGLKKGIERLADGETDYRTADTRHMLRDFRVCAEKLGNVGTGLEKAVDEKVKSERFKAELITNVSHDIKTPLTSIINYVDLLKKETPTGEKAAEYIDVLDRQSRRLKKLTEDLVEASKASTGSIAVDRQPTELGVLLSQALGEYEERMTAAGLKVICEIPGEPIILMTDGRLLWRVFDNLLSNICKYAQPDTRVYISLTSTEKGVSVIFRNISRYELNIPGEELMERFVRGDKSRNTEGSGLGLSIAGSLTQLLGGRFDIIVDGDLFKAVLSFG